MKYWNQEFKDEAVSLHLCAASNTVVVALLQEKWSINPNPLRDTWWMGPTAGDGYSGVDDACRYFFGEYLGHLQIDLGTYEEFPLGENTWLWSVEAVVAQFMPRLRSIRLGNDYIDPGEAKFFSTLGFDEFFPSRHVMMTKEGRLPALVE